MMKLLAAVMVLFGASLAWAASWGAGGGAMGPITSFSFGTQFRYDGTQAGGLHMDGDTFGITWSDDGNSYMLFNDTHGPQDVGPSSNVALTRVAGFDSTMVVTLVNRLTQWGTLDQNTGSPLASHKTGGLISVAHNLYAVDWRKGSGSTTSGFDGQLIKSVDHGANFVPAPPTVAAPYASVMWPGYDYPYGWVQYGKDYTGNGPDKSDLYVYAVIVNSNPAVPSQNRMGRVAIANIAAQNVADWSYYQGGDGMNDSNWGALATAVRIVEGVEVGSLTSIQYLPRYKAYVGLAYKLNGSTDSQFAVYQAPHPWGPWSLLGYSAKYLATASYLTVPFIAPSTVANGGQSLYFLSSTSNFVSGCGPSLPNGWYCPISIQLTLGP